MRIMTITEYARIIAIIIVFCSPPLFLPLESAVKPDSLMQRILSCRGEARLEAYAAACEHTTRKDGIGLLRAYEAEAARQGDVEHETSARTLRLYTFYNNNMLDSLNGCVDDDLHFMKKNKQWVFYYSCRSLKVEKLLQWDNKLQSALHESQSMYEDASRQKTDYGKGMSAYLIACCYQRMKRDKEAVEFFMEAEKYLSKENNTGQMHNLYAMGWLSFAAAGKTAELVKLIDRWDNLWTLYCRENNVTLESVAPYYIVCLLARAHVFIDSGNLPAAREVLNRSDVLATGQLDIVQSMLLKEKARYEEAAGNYAAALRYQNEHYNIQNGLNNLPGRIESQEARAILLLKLGRYEESARIYADLLPRRDSLSRIDMAAQLDDLGLIYKVDTLKMEKAQLRMWMIITSTGCAVFILLLAGYIYYNRKIHAKNRAILLQYEQQKHTERLIGRMPGQNSGEEIPDKDMQLFIKIKNLLQDREALSELSLERKFLAEKLNTNYTYVAQAVQLGAGVTVSKYISKVRIDYACELLRERGKYTISEIQTMCGFQSSTSFNRAFKECVHMTPTEFRKALRG